MDKIKLNLKYFNYAAPFACDGIKFSDKYIIEILVNDINILQDVDLFEGSLLVYSELSKSLNSSGMYLLFTNCSGIADDGGWEYVKVIHEDILISWEISRDDNIILYKFSKNNYQKEIASLENMIEDIKSKLEPINVIFPEE